VAPTPPALSVANGDGQRLELATEAIRRVAAVSPWRMDQLPGISGFWALLRQGQPPGRMIAAGAGPGAWLELALWRSA